MLNTKLLNKQNAKAVHRLSQIISVLTLAGAAIIFLFLSPPRWSLPRVDAVVEQRPDVLLKYPPYSFFEGRRFDIFVYNDPKRSAHALIRRVNENPAAQLPGPNPAGLTLVATMPGKDNSYAIIKGLDGSGETVAPLGSKVRDSLLAKIDSNGVVLTRNAQNATLLLHAPWRTEANNLLKNANISERDAFAMYAFSPPITEQSDSPSSVGLDIQDLGLFLAPLTKEEREALDLNPDTGLRITKVVREDLNASPGDLLAAVAGKPVGNVGQVLDLLQQSSSEYITLTLVHKGMLKDIRVAVR